MDPNLQEGLKLCKSIGMLTYSGVSMTMTEEFKSFLHQLTPDQLKIVDRVSDATARVKNLDAHEVADSVLLRLWLKHKQLTLSISERQLARAVLQLFNLKEEEG